MISTVITADAAVCECDCGWSARLEPKPDETSTDLLIRATYLVRTHRTLDHGRPAVMT